MRRLPLFAAPRAVLAPTWTPQSALENWSARRARVNFSKRWGGSSPCGLGRVMPKLCGARYEGARERESRVARLAFSTRSVVLDVCRKELGPTRRDPLGTLPNDPYARFERVRINSVRSSRPQARGRVASTAGRLRDGRLCSHTGARAEAARVTAERQPSGVMPRRSSFEFGVSVLARMAQLNRAFAKSSFEDRASAHNQRREHQTRRCTLQNGLPAKSSAAHGVHG